MVTKKKVAPKKKKAAVKVAPKKKSPKKKIPPKKSRAEASRENGKLGGVDSKFKPEYCRIAKAMSRFGAIDSDLAEEFKVSVRTIQYWKVKHPTFAAALRQSKKIANKRVRRSLYERATGYDHEETKVFCNDGRIITKTVTKHHPPEVNAIKMWLYNREPDKWRDTKHIAGDEEVPLIPQEIKIVYEE